MTTIFGGHTARKSFAVLAVGIALVLTSNFAMAGIAATRHNLGSTNVAPTHPDDGTPANTFDGTAEICIFCHTPHGGDSSAAAPLWNRHLGAPGSYTRYSQLGTATFDAAEAPVGSVSIGCLSCHDGTQAMNVVINAPGTGSQQMTGTWTGGRVSAAGFMQPDGTYNFPRLGTDLRDDHPISMQFGGGGISVNHFTGLNSDGRTVDTDFATAYDSSTTTGTYGTGGSGTGAVNHRTLGSGKVVWWVDTGTAGQQKTDLTLYTRSDASGGVNPGEDQPFVECASCHDPHSTNSTFLRIPNAGSGLCLTCHAK